MLRRISFICVALVVAITAILLDTQTAEAQLFRRLRSRIQSAIPVSPPVQLQRPQQQISPQPRIQLQPQSRPQGQRVSPIAPQPTAKPPERATAAGKKFGNSILAPAQTPEATPGSTQKSLATEKQNNATAGTSPAATPAPRRASLGIDVVQSRGGMPGLKVVGFNDRSNADEAGLELDDLIVAVDGKETPTIADIAQVLKEQNSGAYIRASIVRDGTKKTLVLPLIRNPLIGNQVAAAKPPTASPTSLPERSIELGIDIEPSNGHRGVIVANVAEHSPAAAAGLQVGDRIVSFDGRLLASNTVSREFNNLKVGDEISLQVVRNGKLIAADVKMIDPTNLAKTETKQKTTAEGSIFGGIGSALGGLLGGRTNSKPESSALDDEMAFDDNEPIQQVGFESEIERKQKELKGDPPSLETLELPTGVATPIQLSAPQQQPKLQSPEDLREKIRRLEQQLKDLKADLK